MINQFTNQYSLMKTLRFEISPVGETESFIKEREFIEKDEQRAENATKVKAFMDQYHKIFIESVLSSVNLTGLDDYAQLYFEKEKDDKANKAMADMEGFFCSQIAKKFDEHPNYKKLYGKEMLTEILPSFLTNEEDKDLVASFKSFTTYFYDFYTTRKTFYSKDAPVNSIPYRCIKDNLPKFLDNVKLYSLAKDFLPEEDLQHLSNDLSELVGYSINDIFKVESFNDFLSQSGIDKYNTVIGGYSTSDGHKIKGINEYINQYNQKVGKEGIKIPLFERLYKQILSESKTFSFVANKLASDEDVLSETQNFHENSSPENPSLSEVLPELKRIFINIYDYDINGIFVTNDRAVVDISKCVFGFHDAIQRSWNNEYDENFGNGKRKDSEKYIDQRANVYKKQKSFSIGYIQALGDKVSDKGTSIGVVKHVSEDVLSSIRTLEDAYTRLKALLNEPRTTDKKLRNDEIAISQIKDYLDAVETLQKHVKPLLGSGKEDNRDVAFYNTLSPLYEKLSAITGLYNSVRNYLTTKPYSTEKLKLTFNVGDFFSGWAQDFSTKSNHIIRKGEEYYLMTVDKKLSKDDINALLCNEPNESAIIYRYHFLKADNKMMPKMFINSGGGKYPPIVKKHNLPIEDIIVLYNNRIFLTEHAKIDPVAQKKALEKLIDYYKLGIPKHESFKHFNVKWKPTSEYNNIQEFYNDVENSCYTLTEETVDFGSVLNFVKEGKVYLYKFNNKDFSSYSKGTPNLHTMYFKALFNSENLANPVYKLNGGVEMHYRKSSISDSDKIVHPALYPIENKNPGTEKKTSVFDYDIIKDRRYTKDKLFIHIPITLNFGSPDIDGTINKKVRAAIKETDETYVIGINRGERNLVFATVIDGKGNVIEQRSFNIIRNVDYHELLDRKEKERANARENWQSINSIKNIKDGYISHVVHEICNLVVKYDAVIAMEDLNFEFKKSRKKIEKQVYQNFEKMLVDKLNYLVIKNREAKEEGGLFHAYQLTSKIKSFSEMRGQNGIIFYVPSWFVSKTEPTTGFVDLFGIKYTNVKDAQSFFSNFEDIRYNASEDYFEFTFNYASFALGTKAHRNHWTVCTYGDRIHKYINPKTNLWTNESVVLSRAFKKLFEEFDIDYTSDLKRSICEKDEKAFFERLITLFSLTVQIRNSVIGDTDADFVISPCKNANGAFYDSRKYKGDASAILPASADANDAYNIARKGLWAVNVLKDTPDELLPKVKLSISNKDWLKYAQEEKIQK